MKNEKLQGFLILSHYPSFEFAAEHDVIYTNVPASETDAEMGVILENLGFYLEDENTWAVVV